MTEGATLVGAAPVLPIGAPSLQPAAASTTVTRAAARRTPAPVLTGNTVGDPPGSVGIRMHLALGQRRYDLRTRALVMGALGLPDALVAGGADILELDPADATLDQRALGLPVCTPAADEAAVGRALSGGADLIHLRRPTRQSLDLCAAAGVSVLVPLDAAQDAAAAGFSSEHLVVDSLLLDVVGEECPVAATAAGVIRGARIVRTDDVRAARRICDVLAAVMEAR